MPDSANDGLTFGSDEFTGAFTYQVPVVLPPARGGFTPTVGLHYSSSGGPSTCGYGWSLGECYIERQTKHGSPLVWNTSVPAVVQNQYDDLKGFVVSLDGSTGNLVKSTAGDYYAEVERSFTKFTFDVANNQWIAVDTGGNKCYFGDAAGGHPANQTFRWCLTKRVDPDGNQISYTYVSGSPLLGLWNSGAAQFAQLQEIRYNENGNASVPKTYSVLFNYEYFNGGSGHNIQGVPPSYRAGFLISGPFRLSSIAVRGMSANTPAFGIRTYSLSYNNSSFSNRDLLSVVTEQDDAGSAQTRVVASLQYTQNNMTFGPLTNWPGVEFQGAATGDWTSLESADANGGFETMLIDIDGDGLPDRVMRERIASGNYSGVLKVQRNTGSAFAKPVTWPGLDAQGYPGSANWNSPKVTYGAQTASPATQITLLDMNGDGLPDRVMRLPSAGTNGYIKLKVQLNTGISFAASQDWTIAAPNDAASGSPSSGNPIANSVIDINGDGLPDRVTRMGSAGANYFQVQLNTGSGFDSKLRRYSFTNPASSLAWNSLFGFQPFVPAQAGSYVNGVYTPPRAASGGSGYVALADINGDGILDRVYRNVSSPYDSLNVQYGTGAGFPSTGSLTLSSQGDTTDRWNSVTGEDGNGMTTYMVDLDGDHLPDRVERKILGPFSYWAVQFNRGGKLSGTTRNISIPVLDPDSFWSNVIVEDPSANHTTAVTLIDMNGDGLPDRVLRGLSPFTSFRVQFNNGPVPDLLQRVTNVHGGSIIVNYVPSTIWNNRTAALSEDPNRSTPEAPGMLPFVFQTVESISVDPGTTANSPVQVTHYSYEGGYFDPARREFAGFQKVAAVDALGTVTIAYFHQGGGRDAAALGEWLDSGSVAKKGHPYRVEIRNDQGGLMRVIANKYEEVPVHGAIGSYFACCTKSVTQDYEGTSGYRASAQEFTYDPSNGNLLTNVDRGEVMNFNPATYAYTVANDEVKTTTLTYDATGLNADIRNRVHTQTINSTGWSGWGLLRQSRTEYYSDGRVKDSYGTATYQGASTEILLSHSEYFSNGNLHTQTDAAGVTLEYLYDDADFALFPTTLKKTSGTQTLTTTRTYQPANGALLTSTDPKGVTSIQAYGDFLRPTDSFISFTEGGTLKTVWKIKRVINGNGDCVITSVNTGDGGGGLVTYSYQDGLGRTIQTRVQSETVGQYRVTDTAYDERGAKCYVTYPYLSSGSGYVAISAQTPPPGISTEFDSLGRPTSQTPAVGDTGSPTVTSHTSYLANGQIWATRVWDDANHEKILYHDGHGRVRVISEMLAGGGSTVIGINADAVGQLRGCSGGSSLETTGFDYDTLGRKRKMTDTSAGVWLYDYDNASRLVLQTAPNGTQTKFIYEATFGRLSERQSIVGSTVTSLARYTYDQHASGDQTEFTAYPGQLAKVEDREGWMKIGYDLRGRKVRVRRYLSKTNQSYTMDSTFDDADHLVNYTYPFAAAQLHYAYDSYGHLASVTDVPISGHGQTNFFTAQGYNQAGAMTQALFGDGQTTTWEYFPNSRRLKGIKTSQAGGGYCQDLQYTFDGVANLKTVTDNVYTGAASSGMTNMQYDRLNRLTSITTVSGGTYNYQYDPAGNIISNGEDPSGGSCFYDEDHPNQLQSIGNHSYAYDAAGNVVSRSTSTGTQTLNYNDENRLTEVVEGSSVTAFGYGDGGERLWRQAPNGDVTVWIGSNFEIHTGSDPRILCHVLAGSTRIATFEPAGLYASNTGNGQVYAASLWWLSLQPWLPTSPLRALLWMLGVVLLVMVGALHLSGTLGFGRASRRRVPAMPRTWASSLFGRAVASLTLVATLGATTHLEAVTPPAPVVFYYYHSDHLGSASVLTDSSGNLIQHFGYTPYGRPNYELPGANVLNPSNRYTDQVYDAGTGLYQFGPRYYDPNVGRFIQPDSVTFTGETSQGFNRYAYTGNNPLTRIDPSGHSWEDVFNFLGDAVSFVAEVFTSTIEFAVDYAVPIGAAAFGIALGWEFIAAAEVVSVVEADGLAAIGGFAEDVSASSSGGALGIDTALSAEIGGASSVAPGGLIPSYVPTYASLGFDSAVFQSVETYSGVTSSSIDSIAEATTLVGEDTGGTTLIGGSPLGDSGGTKLALGSRFSGLRTFASDIGAEHLLGVAEHEWKDVFLSHVGNPSTSFHVTMGGFFGDTTHEMILNEIGSGSNTGWELLQLQNAGRLPQVNFYLDGILRPNPFLP